MLFCFQWARIVLLVERGIPPAERLKQQDLYAERMATGQKALVLKQTMSVSFQCPANVYFTYNHSKNHIDN